MTRNSGTARRGIRKHLESVFGSAERRAIRRQAVGGSRALHVEGLEDRRLLAGLVTVTTNAAGDVMIRGDNAANTIFIESWFPDLKIEGDSGTQISYNGSVSNQAFVFPYVVIRDLKIDMLGGNDQVFILDVDVGRDLKVNLGSGNDGLFLNSAGVGRDLIVHLGGGTDGFILDEGSYVGRNLRVDAGGGNHENRVDFWDSTIGGNVFVDLGGASSGWDRIFGGRGLLILGDLTIKQSSGIGHVELWNFTVHGNTRITTGSGEDFVWLGFQPVESRLIGTFTLDTGTDNDTVILEELWIGGKANVKTGSGNDTLSIERFTVGASEFRVDLGAGDDRLEFFGGSGLFANPRFYGPFIANGGSGNDTLVRPGIPTYNVTPVFTSFENIINPNPPGIRVTIDVNERIFRDYEELTGYPVREEERISEIFHVA